MPSLQILMEWVQSGKIRDNAEQAAGWLIIIGAIEYGEIPPYKNGDKKYRGGHYGDITSIQKPMADGCSNWKCGAYEPSCRRHGDIEYLYILDLEKKTISCYSTHIFSSKDKDATTFPANTDNLQFVDSAENPWKAS